MVPPQHFHADICMQLLEGMEEDSRLNLTPSGDRRERSYLKNQIELNISQNKGEIGSNSIVPANSHPLDRAPHVSVGIVGTSSSSSSGSSSSRAGNDISVSSVTTHSLDVLATKGDRDLHLGTDPSISHPHPPVYTANSSDSQTKQQTVNRDFPAKAYVDQRNSGKRKASECETNDYTQLNNNYRNGGL